MKTIYLPELFNFFAECDTLRNVHGVECSFEIEHDNNRFVISWGRNYETMEHEFTDYFPFDKNHHVEISDKGVIKLKNAGGSSYYYTFTKTLTLSDFE
jgi:hypothetical protein